VSDQQRYGTDAGLGERQIHTPPAETLIEVRFGATADTVSVGFEVPIPDSRLRVKISVLFVPDSDQDLDADPVTDLAATLYLGAADYEVAGINGRRVLTTDVLRDADGNVIHSSAPLAIPEDPGLSGFSQEFVTSGDTILGTLVSGQNGPSGRWILQVRYQPEGQRLHECDWSNAIRRCNPRREGAMGLLTTPE
jgi:hypothetical protein